MVAYYGDFAEDDTVYIPFNTFDSNDPQGSVTATDLIASDIYVHKDGSATPITTDGATIDVDVNAIAGSHMITIDTSVDAAYATGSEYSVRIEGATVDTGTVNAWVGSFSIERAGGVLALLKGATGLAAIDTVVDTINTNVGTAGAGLTNLGGSGNNWNVGKTGYTLTATTGLGNQTANITGNLSGSVGSVTGHTPQTGDVYALANGATGFAAIDTVVDAIKVNTDKMTWTVANQLDCNIQYINDAAVTGDGNATPWDGA